MVAAGGFPGVAAAHGSVAPIASSYLARVNRVSAGLDAQVVDGDQRMWLQVGPSETVVVFDYRGAPYLRFSAAGVDVNQNSAMYYLNQTPVAESPPSNLSRATPPNWQRMTGAHAYGWHDGRLHALATVALSPGVANVGKWSIPVLVNGRLTSISGGLWHAENSSMVWFWPIVVLLLCVLAAWRVRQPALDALVARVIGIAALIAIAARRPAIQPMRSAATMTESRRAWSSESARSVPRLVPAGGLMLTGAVLLLGCGSARRSAQTFGIPPALVAEARPIGRGPRFHPPATGPVRGRCRPRLGRRVGVHVELFAANRVVLIAAGIGTRPPRRFSEGRISGARCDGDLVTSEPTGVVLVRAGARLLLSDLFRAWGQPLSVSRLASFSAPAGTRVAVFVDGRPWHGSPGSVPLTRHSEIVLEVGPHVPPHSSYTFPPGA